MEGWELHLPISTRRRSSAGWMTRSSDIVPPLVSFPPWWRRRDRDRRCNSAPPGPWPLTPAGSDALEAPGRPGPRWRELAHLPDWQPFDVSPVKGQVEVTVDASGQVFLRGVVTSEEAGREIEEAARSVPGVSRVQSQFQVLPRHAADENPPPREGDPVEPRRAPAGDPPPPPEPILQPADAESRVRRADPRLAPGPPPAGPLLSTRQT